MKIKKRALTFALIGLVVVGLVYLAFKPEVCESGREITEGEAIEILRQYVKSDESYWRNVLGFESPAEFDSLEAFVTYCCNAAKRTGGGDNYWDASLKTSGKRGRWLYAAMISVCGQVSNPGWVKVD